MRVIRIAALAGCLALTGPAAAHEDSGSPDGAAIGPVLSDVPCMAGSAAGFPCFNVDLRAFLPVEDLATTQLNDVWGWTDPVTGVDHAIVGTTTGVAFVSLADPGQPVVLGHLPSPSVFSSIWGDIRVHADHAFLVKESFNHGLQVFDLTRLRGVPSPPVTFDQDARVTGFGNAHNVATNPATGLGIVVGSNTCSGGLRMFDLNDPLDPSFLGCYSGDGYTHDVQCVIYAGPDPDHQGSEICFASNEDTLTIVDVTDRGAPVQLARESYPGVGYVHQGGLTPDQRWFLQGDELDEHDLAVNTRTHVWDVADLDAPVWLGFNAAATPAIDHNLFVVGDHVVQASYRAGVRFLRTGDLDELEMAEVAYFDTIPADDAADFSGVWGVHRFDSGIVVATDIYGGLFVLEPHLDAVPECDDGIDNDRDGTIDAAGGPGGEAADAGCFGPTDPVEARPPSGTGGCGLGPELLPGLALLVLVRRRQRR